MICLSMQNRRITFAVAAVFALSGCATTGTTTVDPADPWEPANRTTYAINDTLDRALLKPVSDLYLKLPEGIRGSVRNFFDNAAYPGTVLNQLLQGKFKLAMEDSMRFVLNSTLGVAGLFDVSSGLGLERHEEDLGQTLAVWGMGEGNFVNYPLFGPSSIRDTPGLAADAMTNVLTYTPLFPLTVLEIVDARANLDKAIKLRDESAVDPYIFTREAYRQRRNFLIHDGSPPLDDFDEAEEGGEN